VQKPLAKAVDALLYPGNLDQVRSHAKNHPACSLSEIRKIGQTFSSRIEAGQ
jgi:hypothetical protein